MQEIPFNGRACVLIKLSAQRSVVVRANALQQVKGNRTWGTASVEYGPAPHSECVEYLMSDGDTCETLSPVGVGRSKRS
jgi:hypothetical protein